MARTRNDLFGKAVDERMDVGAVLSKGTHDKHTSELAQAALDVIGAKSIEGSLLTDKRSTRSHASAQVASLTYRSTTTPPPHSPSRVRCLGNVLPCGHSMAPGLGRRGACEGEA
jgi:hypothetical protein